MTIEDTPSGELHMHVMLFIVSADLPARADLVNMKNFNGKWACNLCKDCRQPIGNGLHRVWLFNNKNELRSHDEQREYNKAVKQSKPVMGCKGLSVFYKRKSEFKLTTGFSIDWMHYILLGVTKVFYETHGHDIK